MKKARWIGAGLISAIMAIPPIGPLAAQEHPPPPPPRPEGATQAQALREAAGPRGRVSVHDETGLVRFVGTPAGDPINRDRSVARTASPEAAARAFLARYGAAFGASQPSKDLAVDSLVTAPDGRVTVRFTQEAAPGIPVLAGGLSVQLDRDRDVLAAAGELLPPGEVSTEPAVPGDEAAATAAAVVARAQDVDASVVTTTPPALAVYNPALLGGPGVRGNRLVWQTEATGSGANDPFRELVLIDAETGGVALHFDQMAHGRDRRICDDNNKPSTAENCSTAGPVIRVEGGPATGLTDADAAYEFSGDTYDFFFSRFNRDSLDGAGMPLYSETRFCYRRPTSCPYANAFWNGAQMTYGQGFALADDVVGHELTHGVTEFTSGLYYYYQSGAINESMSDVFGELIDLTNGAGNDTAAVRWKMGEDIPSIGAIRDMADPTAFGDPDRMTSGIYSTSAGDNGGVHSNSGVNNKAASLLGGGGSFNGYTVTALGVDKVAAIYYEVETGLLQSGSDYGDLYDMLQQACTNLVGGVEGITVADCAEVTDAVAATEMNLEPPAIANPDAPLCAVGDTKTDLLTDSIPELAPGWTPTSTAGQPWVSATGYAHSDPFALWDLADGTTTDSIIQRIEPVAVPAGVSTYLLFNHANEFEAPDWDGGVVEYSTTGAVGSWLDAGPLFDHGGYNGTIRAGGTNPLAGRAGFVSASRGYRQSRIDLTTLAGENVHFRFRTGTDISVGALGWLVDDLSVFSCAALAAPQGDWVGVYGGTRGHLLAAWDDATDLDGLNDVTIGLSGLSRYRWSASTSDVRALESPDESVRRAATFYTSGSGSVSLTFGAAYVGDLHLYAIDWDSTTRRQTIAVNDGSVQATSLSSPFDGGAWIHVPIDADPGETVTITMTRTAGANAVLSGIFLGEPGPSGITVDQPGVAGDWVGAYGGARGHLLAAWDDATDLDGLNDVTIGLSGLSRYRWSASTSDVRALESPDESVRRAATFYTSGSGSVSLTFGAAYVGDLHLYAVDWDSTTRRQTIAVNDGSVQATSLSSPFDGGAWIHVPIDADPGETVTITMTRTAGANAVLSGIFLG